MRLVDLPARPIRGHRLVLTAIDHNGKCHGSPHPRSSPGADCYRSQWQVSWISPIRSHRLVLTAIHHNGKCHDCDLCTRSEYWKSVPRKFCEFCKCWITDNKPSVDFHERGKRHKENVELKLKEVRKKSLQNSINDAQMTAEMEKMEKAAMEAFKKDLKDDPSLAAKYGVSLEAKPQKDKETEETSSDTVSAPSASLSEDKEWFEAVTPEGYHYYWSTVTGDSRWDPPEEFVSLQEQESSEKKEEQDAGSVLDASGAPGDALSSGEAKPERNTTVDPSNSRSAYGSWDIVKEIERPVIYHESSVPPALEDIPLPTDSKLEQASSHRPKFKERTVTSLSSSSPEVPTTFKKRKVASGARNIRQKDSND